MPHAYCERGSLRKKFVQLEVAWIEKEIKELLRVQNFGGKLLSLTQHKRRRHGSMVYQSLLVIYKWKFEFVKICLFDRSSS